jgi:hypothetical protein
VDLIECAPGTPGDETPKANRDGARTLRTAVAEAEPHVRVLALHLNELLGQDPVTEGGGLYPVQRNQTTTVLV